MGPFLFNSHSDGPAMVLPHPQDHPSAPFPSQPMLSSPAQSFQAHSNGGGFHQTPANGAHSVFPNSTFLNSSSWTPSSSITPLTSNPSRKRSRDESANDEAETWDKAPAVLAPVAPATPAPEEEPIYGEGMVLLNPKSGMVLSAESQTGTWYEERAEHLAAAEPPVSVPVHDSHGADLPSRKSQRLDTSAPGLDDIGLASIQKKLQFSDQDNSHRQIPGALTQSNTSPTKPAEPCVDDFTHLLGISWQRIGGSETDMAAAVRGWAKYINHHYPRHIQDAEILLKNRGLNAYLVAGKPPFNNAAGADTNMNGIPTDPNSETVYYLFSEDLSQGQLVGRDWDTCLRNLRAVPVAFEGMEPVRAEERTPERAVEDKGVLIGNTNGVVNGSMASGGVVSASTAEGMDIDA